MKQIRRLLLIAIVPALAIMLPLAAIAQSSSPPAPDSPETLQEQALALEAERGARTPLSPISPSQPLAVQYPLFVGVDDVTVPAYLIDPLTNDTIEAFTSAQVWGAAYDVDNDKVYFNQGTTLYEWPVGGAVNTLGTIVDAGANPQAMVGLAYHGGILYGTKNIANEAVWIINTDTLVATVYIDYVDADYDFGGLAVDPRTGILYGTNDDATPHGSGLFRINPNGTATLIAPTRMARPTLTGWRSAMTGKPTWSRTSRASFTSTTWSRAATSPHSTTPGPPPRSFPAQPGFGNLPPRSATRTRSPFPVLGWQHPILQPSSSMGTVRSSPM
jgi:hypothetical protein